MSSMQLVSGAWEMISPNINPYPISHILNTSRNRTKAWQLHPRHQRYDHTWTEENRELYIDSVEKNIAQASTITLSIKIDAQGREQTYILDGGHRIDTIKRFCGEKGEEFMFRDPHGRLYSDFNDDTKLNFDGRLITVVTYRNLTEEQEDLLFMRINRHLELAQGETINAQKSVPICLLAHQMAEKYKHVLCNEKVGLGYCNGERMEEKAFVFVLCINFILGRVQIYEKPGTKVLSEIERYRFIQPLSLNEKTKLEKEFVTLFNTINVPMSSKFKFHDLLVAQWLMLNAPEDLSSYKRFMKAVHLKKSVWADKWKDAVKNDSESNHARIAGLDEKNLASRVRFFREMFMNQ